VVESVECRHIYRRAYPYKDSRGHWRNTWECITCGVIGDKLGI